MLSYQRLSVLAAIFLAAGCTLLAQENDNEGNRSVLHIQNTVTTSQVGFPTYSYVYRVLDGARSPAAARALTGTISIENHGAEFSEVLMYLVYWQSECPANSQGLDAATSVIWSDILKNPTKSKSRFNVDLYFPHPLPMTGCVGFVINGGPLVQGTAAVTMSADLDLVYEPALSDANTVLDLTGEYCFGQNWGCQNATTNDGDAFAVPIPLPAGHLTELFGNISDSTFDGSDNYGPLPTGKSWGAVNDFYLLRGSCGKFGNNLNSQGFPNPKPLATLEKWLPEDALHLKSVPLERQISCEESARATLDEKVERIFAVPVKVNEGDCMVVIYGRTGDGATDNETQVRAVMAP